MMGEIAPPDEQQEHQKVVVINDEILSDDGSDLNKSMVSQATLAGYTFIKDEMSRVRKSIAYTQEEQLKLELERKENNLDEATLIKNLGEILRRSMKIRKDVDYLIERLSKCISGSKYE